MSKKTSFLLVVVLLIALVVIGVCYLRNVTNAVTSDDGQVTLNIQQSALPDHIDISDISVKKVENSDFELKLDGQDSLYTYEFQPAGLYLLEPVDFNIDIPIEDDVIPALYSLSDYGVSRMNGIDITIDSTKGSANIQGKTEHFSYFYVSVDGITMMLTSPKEANVGEQFQVQGTVQIVNKASRWNMAGSVEADNDPFQAAMFKQWKEAAGIVDMFRDVEVGELKYKMPWELKGNIKANPANVITPTSIDDAPERTKVEGNSYGYTGKFTCKSPGQATIEYQVEIFAEMEMEWKINPPFDISFESMNEPSTIKKISNTECKAAPMGEEGIGGGGGGGNGGGEEGGEGEEGEEGEEPEEDDEDEGEHEGLQEAVQECPDCEGLEAQLEALEGQIEELEEKLDDKQGELDDAEDAADELDEALDELIKDSGCDPALGLREGAMLSGASSGSVTSRGRDFYCPTQAAAEAMIDALKEFWKDHKSPSQVRNELRQIQKQIDKLELDMEGIENVLKDCPCVAVHNPPPFFETDEKEIIMGDPIDLKKMIGSVNECEDIMEELNLEPSGEDSAQFKIEGELPNWIEFDPPSGDLPSDVDLKMDCDKFSEIEPGTYNSTASIDVYNKENKKIKAIPVNMIFGIMLVEGGEELPPTTGESDGGAVVMDPDLIEFTYDHANPTCPLPIDPVNISGPVGGQWVVTTDPPVWLGFPQTSGSIPGTIDMNFPCRLDRYENQEQSATVSVDVQMPDGTTQQFEFNVDGKFMNF